MSRSRVSGWITPVLECAALYPRLGWFHSRDPVPGLNKSESACQSGLNLHVYDDPQDTVGEVTVVVRE